jgi:hypothetical protein
VREQEEKTVETPGEQPAAGAGVAVGAGVDVATGVDMATGADFSLTDGSGM